MLEIKPFIDKARVLFRLVGAQGCVECTDAGYTSATKKSSVRASIVTMSMPYEITNQLDNRRVSMCARRAATCARATATAAAGE